MTCPEVYKTDDEGYAYVEQEDVPKGLEEKVRRGAEVCPENAIILTR
jgi:ferredoxin